MPSRAPTPPKAWYKSKFFWFALALALVEGFTGAITQVGSISGLTLPKWVPLVQSLSVIVIIPILRQYTTGPLLGGMVKQLVTIAAAAILSFTGTYLATSAAAPDVATDTRPVCPDCPDTEEVAGYDDGEIY